MFSTKAVLYRLLARKLYTFKYALHRSLNTHSWESRIISKWIEKILLVSGDYFVFNKRGRPFNYCVIKFKSHRLLQNLHYLYIHTVCFVIKDYVSFCAVYLLKYMVYLSLCRKILYIIKKKKEILIYLTWLGWFLKDVHNFI